MLVDPGERLRALVTTLEQRTDNDIVDIAGQLRERAMTWSERERERERRWVNKTQPSGTAVTDPFTTASAADLPYSELSK